MNIHTEYMCPILGKKYKTESEMKILMKSFKANPYPGTKEKLQLAKSLNTSKVTIEKWLFRLREKKSKEGFMKISE